MQELRAVLLCNAVERAQATLLYVAREKMLAKRVLQGSHLIDAWLGNWSVLEMQQ